MSGICLEVLEATKLQQEAEIRIERLLIASRHVQVQFLDLKDTRIHNESIYHKEN